MTLPIILLYSYSIITNNPKGGKMSRYRKEKSGEEKMSLLINSELHGTIKVWCAQHKILIKDFTENALKREMIRESRLREIVK